MTLQQDVDYELLFHELLSVMGSGVFAGGDVVCCEAVMSGLMIAS